MCLLPALVASVMLPALAQSQSPPMSRRAVSVEVALGPSVGKGGRRDYVNDGGAAAELLVGVRRVADRHRMWAVTAGSRGSIANGDSCFVRIPPTGEPGCRPDYPTMVHLGVLGGWELRRSAFSLRAMGGPALYRGLGEYGVGAQSQLDAAVGSSHVAIVTALRVNAVSLLSGESLRYRSLTVGLRFR